VTSTSAEHKCHSESLALAPSSANSLLIVKSHWRHVGQHDGLEAAYINAYLHCGGDTQYVDQINLWNGRTALYGVVWKQDIPEMTLSRRLIICLPS
jgi:hypothetical protein